MSVGVDAPLLVVRRRTAYPGARDVAAVAVRADEIGVEAHHVASLDGAHRALPRPRIGARPRGQQARLEPFGAAGDAALVQPGPEGVLRDAGLHRRPHLLDGLLAHRNGVAHQRDLAGRLDLAGILHDRETVEDPVTVALHLEDTDWRDPIDGDAPVPPAALPDDRIQIRRPRFRLLRLTLPGQEVEERNAWPDFVHRGQSLCEQSFPSQLEQANRPLGGHVDVTHLVVAAPDLHVGRIDRVPGVYLVVEYDPVEVALGEGLAYPPEPISAHAVQVAGCVGVLHRTVLS